MKFAKRSLMVAGMLSLAVLIVAVLAPNTAHGLVAALVQVTNGSSNPIPIEDLDSPGRNIAMVTGQVTVTQQITTVPLTGTARGMVMDYFSATCNAPSQGANSAQNYVAEISLHSPVLADDGSFSGNYSTITTFLPQQATSFGRSQVGNAYLFNTAPRLRPASWSPARSAAQSSSANTPTGTDYVVSQPVTLYVHPLIAQGASAPITGLYVTVVLSTNDATVNGHPTCQFSAQGHTISSVLIQ